MALQDNYPGTAEPYFALVINAANDWGGQSFTTSSSYTLESIEIYCKKGSGDNVGTIDVELYTVDGSGHPDTKVAQGTIADGSISDSAYGWISCTLGTPYVVSTTTKYCIVVHGTSLSASNVLYWSFDDDGFGSSAFAGGDQEWSTDGGSSWLTETTQDQLFKCYDTVDYVDIAATGGGTGGGSAALTLESFVDIAGTGGGTGGGSADLYMLGMPTGTAGVTYVYRRLVAAGNDEIFYEVI